MKPQKLKWFAVAISAMIRITDGVRVEIHPVPIQTYTEEEAKQIGMIELMRLHPKEAGWYDHQVEAVEVPV